MNTKYFGLILVLAVVSLTIGNAVTGHGIKGNKNINTAVLASESGTGTGTGTGPIEDLPIWNRIKSNEKTTYGEWEYAGPPATKECRWVKSFYTIDCSLYAKETCSPGDYTLNGHECRGE